MIHDKEKIITAETPDHARQCARFILNKTCTAVADKFGVAVEDMVLAQNHLIDHLVKILVSLAPPKTRRHIVVMSNGAFGGIHGKLLEALKQAPQTAPSGTHEPVLTPRR